MARESNPILEGMKNLQLTLRAQQQQAANARQAATSALYGQAAFLSAVSQLNRPVLNSKATKELTGGVIEDVLPAGGIQDVKGKTQIDVQQMRQTAAKALAEFNASKKGESDVLKFTQAMATTFLGEGSPAELTKVVRTAKDVQATIQGKKPIAEPIERTFGKEKKRFGLFGDKSGTVTVGDLVNIYGQDAAAAIARGLDNLTNNLNSISNPEERRQLAEQYQAELEKRYPELKKFNINIQ